jgi:flagellar hook-associated protein 3 FlgL
MLTMVKTLADALPSAAAIATANAALDDLGAATQSVSASQTGGGRAAHWINTTSNIQTPPPSAPIAKPMSAAPI